LGGLAKQRFCLRNEVSGPIFFLGLELEEPAAMVVCGCFVISPTPDIHIPDSSYVANPDRDLPLMVIGPPKNRTLHYRYCDHSSHAGSVAKCDNREYHDPDYYRELYIFNGILNKKTGDIEWPVGNSWKTTWKKTNDPIFTGELTVAVIYRAMTTK